MLENYPPVLTFSQVREILHIGKNLLLYYLQSGEIPAFHVGRLWRIRKQDLIDFMEEHIEQ